MQTRDLARKMRKLQKIPDQRRGVARRIASGMTAHENLRRKSRTNAHYWNLIIVNFAGNRFACGILDL